MRTEHSKHINHTTNEVQSGGVGVRAHKKNQMGKCGARFLCASGQGGARPEPQPAMTVQLYIRYLDWRLYLRHIAILCSTRRCTSSPGGDRVMHQAGESHQYGVYRESSDQSGWVGGCCCTKEKGERPYGN